MCSNLLVLKNPQSKSVLIRHSSRADLIAISRVHQSAFHNHLSSDLGKSFIVKTLSWYLENPELGFLLHLEEDGIIVGYVTAFYNNGSLKYGSSTTMGQFAFKQAVFSFFLRPWLLFHPDITKKWNLIFKQLKLKIGLKKKNSYLNYKRLENNDLISCSLLSIGIDQKFQGKGYGSQLIDAFEREVQLRFPVKLLELSVKPDNVQAKKAYLRNGWQVRDENEGNCVMFKILN